MKYIASRSIANSGDVVFVTSVGAVWQHFRFTGRSISCKTTRCDSIDASRDSCSAPHYWWRRQRAPLGLKRQLENISTPPPISAAAVSSTESSVSSATGRTVTGSTESI